VLAERLAAELSDWSAVIDGEIVSLDRRGKSQFRDLLFRRGSEWDASPSLHRRWRHWRCKFFRDRYTAMFSRDSKEIPIQSQEDMPCVYG